MLVRKGDFENKVKPVMERAGFAYVRTPRAQLGMFVRSHLKVGQDSRDVLIRGAEEGIHLLFANEKGQGAFFENPDPDDSTLFTDIYGGADYTFRVLNLEPLLKMKLNYVSRDRLKDLIHIVELWESGAITDEILRRVALDPRWTKEDHLLQFHSRFRDIADAASRSGLRRYTMCGQAIQQHFDSVLATAMNRTPEQLEG
jgi:hypothetical protein